MSAEFSDEALVAIAIVSHSIQSGDMRSVDAALRVLAVQNPRLAQDTLDMIRLGLDMAADW